MAFRHCRRRHRARLAPAALDENALFDRRCPPPREVAVAVVALPAVRTSGAWLTSIPECSRPAAAAAGAGRWPRRQHRPWLWLAPRVRVAASSALQAPEGGGGGRGGALRTRARVCAQQMSHRACVCSGATGSTRCVAHALAEHSSKQQLESNWRGVIWQVKRRNPRTQGRPRRYCCKRLDDWLEWPTQAAAANPHLSIRRLKTPLFLSFCALSWGGESIMGGGG